jgi:alkylhydroperoxidase/carboxymuconolactone decarboxylase family protein YurZ
MHENDRLHFHINNAINQRISPEELREALVQAGVYGGTSGWNNASSIARDVFQPRRIPS